MQSVANVAKLQKFGQLNLEKGPCTLICDVENAIDKKTILYSAFKLKTYKQFNRLLFLNREMNKIEIEQEHKLLKMHKKVIKSRTESKQVRISKLTLQIFMNRNWKVLETPENGKTPRH